MSITISDTETCSVSILGYGLEDKEAHNFCMGHACNYAPDVGGLVGEVNGVVSGEVNEVGGVVGGVVNEVGGMVGGVVKEVGGMVKEVGGMVKEVGLEVEVVAVCVRRKERMK